MFLLHRREKGVIPESKKALDSARLNLVRAQSRGFEVRQVANALRTVREENHFAQKLSFIATGGKDL